MKLASHERGTIGNPMSSTGEGIAHPRGRFDVKKRFEGSGNLTVAADLAFRLGKCVSRAEALKFATPDAVNAHFDVIEQRLGSAGSVDEAVSCGVPRILATKHFAGQRIRDVLK